MKLSQGFTLIEVMIGMLVFTIGILGVVSMQTTSIAANVKAQHISTGSSMASSALAFLRPLEYGIVVSGLVPNQADKDMTGIYNLSSEIAPLDAGGDPLDGEVALITMNVAWEDYGHPHTTTFYYFRQDELR